MLTNTEHQIKFKGRDYFGIRELGFDSNGHFIVSLWRHPPPEPRGGYFTSLPISPRDYRANVHKTKAAFRDHGEVIVVYDDWGTPFEFEAERDVLDALLADCKANDLDEVKTAAEAL